MAHSNVDESKLLELYEERRIDPEEESILDSVLETLIDASSNLVSYLTGLLSRSDNNNYKLIKLLCDTFTFGVGQSYYREHLESQWAEILQFMVACVELRDSNENIALQACEFWEAYSSEPDFFMVVRPLIKTLIPSLLKNMVYSDEELAQLGFTLQDTRNKKPAFLSFAQFDDSSEDESNWTLRKCASQVLDRVSEFEKERTVEVLYPLVESYHSSSNVKEREVAILAAGAIAECCLDEMRVHLPELVGVVLATLEDSPPMIQDIACWTLGRYGAWISETVSTEHSYLFGLTLKKLLAMTAQSHPLIQEHSCDALISVFKAAKSDLTPHLKEIAVALNSCLKTFKGKPMRALYDCICTLAESVGSEMGQSDVVHLLIEPFVVKSQTMKDYDPDYIDVLESMKVLVVAAGEAAEPFANELWKTFFNSMQKFLKSRKTSFFQKEKQTDLAIASMNILDAIVVAIKGKSLALIHSCQPNLVGILLDCAKDESVNFRHDTFVFLGDLTIHVYEFIKEHIPAIINAAFTQAARQLTKPDELQISTSQSAVCVVGEIALHAGAEFKPYVPAVLPTLRKLLPSNMVFLNEPTYTLLRESAAVTIGRIGLGSPETVAPHLKLVLGKWCDAIFPKGDDDEKESAVRGMMNIISNNRKHVNSKFLEIIGQWSDPSEDLRKDFGVFLTGLQTELNGAEWSQLYASVPASTAANLRNLCEGE